jgi:phosphatidylserine/phosphatidylglycerophosphate/cardiolipin synthase-like enzyme
VVPHHLPATQDLVKLHGAIMNVTTLTDGGQDPLTIARALHDFLAAAETSLDIALYDFKLDPGLEELVVDTIQDAGRRGIAVRVAYNADFRAPIPVPPPPKSAPEDVARLEVPTMAIAGIPDLMHHKYVVRDRSSIWTGSTNWTDDSWSREENLIITLDSPQLAHAFTLDFEQLWTTGNVEGTGTVEPRPVRVDGIEVRPWFCPGYGDALSHRIAKAIGRAKRRIRICSPVLTAAPVLGTLAQVIADGKVDASGALDQTQIEEVQAQWGPTGVSSWKLPLLLQVVASGRFAGKRSTPWGPGTVHDYMHAKVTVADDVVFLGSFNLSHSGEQNAENVLEIHDPALAEQLAGFVDGVRARYPVAHLDGGRRAAQAGPPDDVA